MSKWYIGCGGEPGWQCQTPERMNRKGRETRASVIHYGYQGWTLGSNTRGWAVGQRWSGPVWLADRLANRHRSPSKCGMILFCPKYMIHYSSQLLTTASTTRTISTLLDSHLNRDRHLELNCPLPAPRTTSTSTTTSPTRGRGDTGIRVGCHE